MSASPSTTMPRRDPGIRRLLGLAAILAVVATVTVFAFAQNNTGPGTSAPGAAPAPTTTDQGSLALDKETGELPTFAELFSYSTYSTVINSIILALSAVAAVLFLFFILTINSRSMAPQDFIDEVTKLALRGKYEQAGDLCRANRGIFIATIIQRCLENAGKPTSVIMGIIDTEGRRRADLLWNRVSYLADISNVGPMLGLLGTVLGMIEAFFVLDKVTGDISSKTLASGVGAAMSTTMYGLMLAILALIFYTIIKGRATQALAETEQAVNTIADHIKRVDPRMRMAPSAVGARVPRPAGAPGPASGAERTRPARTGSPPPAGAYEDHDL